MNWQLLIWMKAGQVLLIFFFSAISIGLKAQTTTIIALQPNQYQQQIADAENAQIVDVRTGIEYNKGHIPGAINISWISMNFAKKVLKYLDKDKPVYIYCQTAHRSPMAAKRLHALGFTEVFDLVDGFKAWKDGGLPVVID